MKIRKKYQNPRKNSEEFEVKDPIKDMELIVLQNTSKSNMREEQEIRFCKFNICQKTHCLKSQFFVKKFNFDKTFSRVFHPIFLVKSKLSTAKKSKTTTFSKVFHPKKIDKFKLNIWTKIEDFEQCDVNSTYIPTWMVLVFGLVLVA